MPTQREESGGTGDLPQDEVEELEDIDEDDLEEETSPQVEDEESGAASLDELLAQRAAARRGSDDADDDDIMALASEKSERFYESATARVIPIKARQEFVCNRCHLVKAKSQLADPQRGLCRDCV